MRRTEKKVRGGRAGEGSSSFARHAPQEHTTSSGLKVVAVKRGAVPLVAARLVLLAGSCTDPKGQAGLADFTARLMRRGTASRTADEINEAIEFIGAGLTLGCAEDYMVVGTTTPAEHLGDMLGVLGELVREPAFPQREFEIEKERVLAQFANDLDDPGLLADRALLRELWPGHPYGHEVVGTAADVDTFTREDVVRFHEEHVGPQVAALYVVGPLEPKAVFEMAERAFGAWSGGPASAQWPESPRELEGGTVLVVDKPEQTQSQVRMGQRAFAKGSKDFFPSMVANVALGAGFTSRLVNEIRVNRGLSYGAGSSFDSLKVSGGFSVSTFTKTESTGEIIEVALNEVKKLRTRGLKPAELKNAQTYVSGLFPLRTETNEALAAVLSDLRIYGLGDDYVERYRDRVRAVTLKETHEVAGRYLFPTPPCFVVVGNAAKIQKQVAKFGKVQVIKPAEL